MNEQAPNSTNVTRPTAAMRVKRCLRWMIGITFCCLLIGLLLIYRAAQPTQPFAIQLQPGLELANIVAVLGNPASSTTMDGATRLVYQSGAFQLMLNFSDSNELVSWTEKGPYQVRRRLQESSCNCEPKEGGLAEK